jgi:nucleoside-diphosphate-sugar epimerase
LKQKILISGLGYIGFNLCKLLKKQPSNDEVVVIDNVFYPDRVHWCQKHDIKFYLRDIFNIRDLIKDADIVIHSAGLTLIPQRKEDETEQISSEIHRVGTLGTREIIENMNKDGKIVFLSTHVNFEGVPDGTENITEETPLSPLLSYSTSKAQSEQDIINSGLNYVICRLGSVFGGSKDSSIRWRIVMNLFARKAALGEKITVVDRNVRKPIIGVKDCCRAIRYLAKNSNKEIYNLVNEHYTVGVMAEICESFVSDLEIEYKGDDNKVGYTLSNEKIKNTGLVFSQYLEREMFLMIQDWRTVF